MRCTTRTTEPSYDLGMTARAVLAVPLLLAVTGIGAACCARRGGAPEPAEPHPGRGRHARPTSSRCRARHADVGTDSPAFEPWFADDDPTNGKGFESAVAYAVADELGFSEDEVDWVKVRFNNSYKPGPKDFDFDINQISITPAREKVVDFSDGYYSAAQGVIALKDSPVADATSVADLADYKLGAQTGTTQPHRDPRRHPARRGPARLHRHQRRQAGAAERPGRRDPRRRADRVLHHRGRDPGGHDHRAVPAETGEQEEFGMLFEKGSDLVAVRRRGARDAARGRHPRRHRAAVAVRRRGRARPRVSRDDAAVTARPPGSPSAVAAASAPGQRRCAGRATAALATGRRGRWSSSACSRPVVVTSPGWPTVQETFFDWPEPGTRFPRSLEGFWLNVRLFLIAEPLILVLGLAVAAARVSTSPLLLPVRSSPSATPTCSAGCPTILVVFLICFGVPTLQLQGVTNARCSGWRVALVLVVRRLRRRGLPGRHRVGPPSQVASATALGLSPRPGAAPRRRAQARAPGRAAAAQRLRLAAEGHRTGRRGRPVRRPRHRVADIANYTFNFTPYVVAAASSSP